MTQLAREQWQRALQALPEVALTEAVEHFPQSWVVQPQILPQSGLGMFKLRESTLGEAFYLGEFPLSHCRVKVTTDDGISAEGAALIMDDRVQYAEQMAFCDAVMSAHLPGWERVDVLIQQGEQCRQQLANERKGILARTRVDFSLLEDAGKEAGDEA